MLPGSAYRRYRRRQRRRRRYAVLLLAAVIAFVAWAQHYAYRHAAADAAAPTGTAPAARPHAPASPVTATVRWTDFHGIEVPVSPQAGPHHVHNGLSGGFTDTRLGAVLASVNIGVRTAAQWGPRIYQPTINHHVIGPAARLLLAADNSDYAALRAAAHVAPGQPAGRGYAVEAAYRLISYTPQSAAAVIVTEGPASNGTTVLAATRVRVRWIRGDWRVVAPRGGTWSSSATTVSSLSGYTIFPSER
jgi:hypothetical protein